MATITIISYSGKPFANRIDAGRIMAEKVRYLNSKDTVVLGIPRGGIIVAAEVARILGSEFDIVLTRKLGAPGNPELAIGAVSENGDVIIDKILAFEAGVDKEYIQEEKTRQLAEILRRNAIYRKLCPKVPLKGKVAIVIDDGVATGATMQSALMAVRREEPKSIITAFPVGTQDSISKLSQYADEIICLRLPDYFSAVGQFYLEFPQVSDEEIVKILEENSKRKI